MFVKIFLCCKYSKKKINGRLAVRSAVWLQSQSAAARQPLVLHDPCHAALSCMCARLRHTATSMPALDKKESPSLTYARTPHVLVRGDDSRRGSRAPAAGTRPH